MTGFGKKTLLASLMAVIGAGCKGEPIKTAQAAPPDGEKKVAPKTWTLSDILKLEKPLIIDVRTPQEFADGHVPGALNIPVSQLPDIAKAIPSKEAPVIVYCASGNRSGRAMSALKGQGYTGVVNGGGVRQMAQTMGVQLVR